MRNLFILSLLIPSLSCFAQTTFTLEYSFGKLKPESKALQNLQKGLKELNINDIDSIHFIGKSDSVGTFLSNFRTTEIRSKKLKKYFAGTKKQNATYTILPTSGKWEKSKGSTRQINVVVFSSEVNKPKRNEEEVPKGCYKVAYTELQAFHQTISSRGKTSYTKIERSPTKSNMNRSDLFYGFINQEGEFEAKRVKWKMEKTGKSWWAKEQEVTEITTEDFDRFKLFTIENFPCSDCEEDFLTNKGIEKMALNSVVDLIVMENIQHKAPFFQRKKVLIRVPQEYIDLNAEYKNDDSKKNLIDWLDKDNDYYYAKVLQQNGEVAPIYRGMPINTEIACNNVDQKDFLHTICGPSQSKIGAYNFAEFGVHKQNGSQIPYASIGMFAGTKNIELEFLIGVHAKAAIYAAIRGRYNIITIPFNSLISGGKWGQSLTNNRFWYSRLYLGTEYKASIGRNNPNYLEPNLHVGLTFGQNDGSIFHRLFVQYGYGVNFIEESPRLSYSMLQLGVQIQLGKKTYRFEKGIL